MAPVVVVLVALVDLVDLAALFHDDRRRGGPPPPKPIPMPTWTWGGGGTPMVTPADTTGAPTTAAPRVPPGPTNISP